MSWIPRIWSSNVSYQNQNIGCGNQANCSYCRSTSLGSFLENENKNVENDAFTFYQFQILIVLSKMAGVIYESALVFNNVAGYGLL